ncbi:hypothetical protein RJT34_31674 [Clitoria ternatea]|uniref:Secreted protein n=1 Tax=Clitoria ternatea TaxID=43366 RepID=A0AAN9I8M2_CLITE
MPIVYCLYCSVDCFVLSFLLLDFDSLARFSATCVSLLTTTENDLIWLLIRYSFCNKGSYVQILFCFSFACPTLLSSWDLH